MPSKPMPVVKTSLRVDDDPITRALAPPPDETAAQRAERHRAEADAKRISDLIDEELNRQRLAERKGPKPVKILLLGVSWHRPPPPVSSRSSRRPKRVR